MEKLFVFAVSILLSASSFAHLGNGSSGGGNIFGNQLNPWFLSNTESVSYCLEVSPDFASIEIGRIKTLIEESFFYWRRTLTYSGGGLRWVDGYIPPFNMRPAYYLELKLEKHCSENVDIKFQLGFLTSEQKKIIPNYPQLLGLAYRESYDEVNLKGKGYIYIAPEEGEDRPVSANMHSKPWSSRNNIALKAALIHELGHVFGLQDNYYDDNAVMGAGWVEKVSAKDAIVYEEMLIPALGCNKYYEGTTGWSAGDYEVSDLRKKLGLSSIETVWSKSVPSRKNVLELFTKDRLLGKIELNDQSELISNNIILPAIKIYVTNKQTVYEEFPDKGYNRYITVQTSIFSKTLNDQILEFVDGSKMQVTVKFNQYCEPSIGAVIDGKFVENIFMSSK